ncbi:MAG: hypothetical protein PWQ57_877 [Desulfovibrionales bacterium]|nr:hypothetical protein [Desulfovibrionales bacterium]
MGTTIAPLQNVTIFSELVERVVSRPAHLPGMATFHGPSGYGKTFAATYAANKHSAAYIELGSSWTKKKFCQALSVELGAHAARTIADMMDEIVKVLALDQRPLIIDEFDHALTRGLLEMVRELHDKSGAPIILIGEELLPDKLAAHERFHNRILSWAAAQPAMLDDVRHLARVYAPGLTIRDDLLERITSASDGRARRACVNIEQVREAALLQGLDSIGLAEWGDAPLYNGRPPHRRA